MGSEMCIRDSDKKTPLLRSMEALSTQAVRALKLFGSNATRAVRITAARNSRWDCRNQSKHHGHAGAGPHRGDGMPFRTVHGNVLLSHLVAQLCGGELDD